MSEIKTYSVCLCDRSEIKHFIEKWHYSKNINGLCISHCFKLINSEEEIIGAMIYGRIAMAGVWKKYVSKESDLVELRRLCCIDDTPKNTESFFIGHTLRYLKKHTKLKTIISYADSTYGHNGTIYKASNFTNIGMTANGKVIMHNGKRYHDKTIRTFYNGKLKPYCQVIKDALEAGEAFYVKTLGKHIYIYNL